jgi:predicted ATP-binding protein involved in virulence
MHIKNLEIKGLFGRFDYSFFFDKNEKIFMFHGHNGSGKTQVLRIIEILCAKRFSETDLNGLNCDSVKLSYSDGSTLHIKKNKKPKDPDPYSIEYTPKGGKKSLLKKKKDDHRKTATSGDEDREYILNKIEDYSPFVRVEPDKWIHPGMNKTYGLTEIITEFSKLFPHRFLEDMKKVSLGVWDTNDLPNIKTNFLNTRRLDYTKTISQERIYHSRWRESRDGGDKNINPLVKLSTNVSNKIKQSSESYSKVSQKLDSLFVSEVLKTAKKEDGNEKERRNELMNKLEALNVKAKNLHIAGIIDEQQSNLSAMMKDLGTDSGAKLLPVFEIHSKNTEEKLEVFDGIYEQISLLTEIINQRFRFKKIRISKENGIEAVDEDTKNTISLESLSSGEQHELYLFASLIFYDNPADILFIDEPEISLHIEWQTSFVSDLLKIKKLANTQIMIATHSPSILGDHFDKAFDLVELHNLSK